MLCGKCDSEGFERYGKCDGKAAGIIHELGSASGCRLVRLAAKAPAERAHTPRTLVHLFYVI